MSPNGALATRRQYGWMVGASLSEPFSIVSSEISTHSPLTSNSIVKDVPSGFLALIDQITSETIPFILTTLGRLPSCRSWLGRSVSVRYELELVPCSSFPSSTRMVNLTSVIPGVSDRNSVSALISYSSSEDMPSRSMSCISSLSSEIAIWVIIGDLRLMYTSSRILVSASSAISASTRIHHGNESSATSFTGVGSGVGSIVGSGVGSGVCSGVS